MREFMIAGLAFAIATPAFAETRALSGFDSVNASGRYSVEVAVGPEFLVSVEGPDAARLRTRVQGNTLKIEPARASWFGNPRYDATVRVTLPALTGVAAARGATMIATAGGACTEFSAAAAMGAELSVSDIQCDSVDAAAAMGAQLTLSGACGMLDVSAAMGAQVDAEALRCETLDASAAMGADVDAFATGTYDASASMGGDVSIAGGATGDRSTGMGGSVSIDRPSR